MSVWETFTFKNLFMFLDFSSLSMQKTLVLVNRNDLFSSPYRRIVVVELGGTQNWDGS